MLFDIGLEVLPGQLFVMTGPSGSGKTTLLTLIGALRSLQEGTIEVLGHDLSRLDQAALVGVRRDIGFIFQMHNLFDALSAYENVKMALQLAGRHSAAEMRERGVGMLERLGSAPHRSQAARAVGRTAPARRDRPRTRQLPAAGPGGRADRRARPASTRNVVRTSRI